MKDFDLLTTEDVAERLGVSVRTVQKWVKLGILPSIETTIRAGGGPVRLIRVSDLAGFQRPRRGRPPRQEAQPQDAGGGQAGEVAE
jgi:excisionase family DNA binding protein